MPFSHWYFYVPGFVVVIAGAVIFRWLAKLQTRVNNHAERIARIEGHDERMDK